MIFVGSFKKTGSSGNVGGQMFACKSLVNSDITEKVDWKLVDTTAESNLKRNTLIRIFKALKRMLKFTYLLIRYDIESVLIFTSSGWSFYEKGMMIRIAHLFHAQKILAPRSGFIIDDLQSNPRFKNFARTVFNKCDYVLCQGEYWKTFFKNHFEIQDHKLVVLKNWIDFHKYSPRKKIRKEKHIQVLFLGWVDKNKGIYDLLEAAKHLKSEPLKFNIAGNGKEFESVRDFVRNNDLKNVKLLGWVLREEKIKLLADSDVLILPSYREGLPNALLEAMSSKLLVIASNVGAIPEVIDDGENGFLIEPGDVSKIVDKLKTIIDNPSMVEEMGEKARMKIECEHSQNSAITVMKKIL